MKTSNSTQILTKKIRHGYRAAIVMIVLQIGLLVASINSDFFNEITEKIPLLLEIIILSVATYGVYKKSRIAITFLVVEFIISKSFVLYEVGRISGPFIFSLIFLIFYIDAMIATYKYHKQELLDSSRV
jgi:hypothetical protein